MRCMSFYIRIDFEVGFLPQNEFLYSIHIYTQLFIKYIFNVYRTQHFHHYRAPDFLFDLWSCNNQLYIIWSGLFGCKSKHNYKYSIFQNQGTHVYIIILHVYIIILYN